MENFFVILLKASSFTVCNAHQRQPVGNNRVPYLLALQDDELSNILELTLLSIFQQGLNLYQSFPLLRKVDMHRSFSGAATAIAYQCIPLIIGRFCFWATLWTEGAGAGGSATSPDPLAIETSEIPADLWQPRRSWTEHQVRILYRKKYARKGTGWPRIRGTTFN